MVCGALIAQEGPPESPMPYDADSSALLLARRYLQGGEDARTAVIEALNKMGWSVRNHQGAVLNAPPSGTDTGLAMRDYELEELLWKPSEQPSIRLISLAQALAVPLEDADPEELAQDLVKTIRSSAESTQPQQRFWGRFIVALGRVGPANYDLSAPSPAPVIPPSPARIRELEQLGMQALQSDPLLLMEALQPRPAWAEDDPVLAASPMPERDEDDVRSTTAERDEVRMDEISDEMSKLGAAAFSAADDARREAAQEKMAKLSAEMAEISNRMQVANLRQSASALQKVRDAQKGIFDDEDEEENDGSRFMAEWRDQSLSLLQVALITRVLAADLRLAAKSAQGRTGNAGLRPLRLRPLPLAAINVAQAAPAPGPSFGDQFVGAGGDIWATGWGAYTGAVLEHHLPENKFSKGAAAANAIIAWFKTIMSVVRQNIVVTVQNAPLVRTKTRAPGEKRTARAKVEIDFPKSDVLKAIRAAGNLTTIDLQLPDGGPVSGAKVVWRLTEGSYNTKYQTAKGGWEYKPEFAVVQFAQAGGNDAYISTTNDAGEATITIEGVPQRKNLPATVRPYPRRAVISVEVTIKVGNLTQDLNDAINTAMGGPVGGALGFVADMVLRTSFFFQAGRVFEVRDWKEPAWEGEFEISIKGAGSKNEKGEKGGPDTEYTWKMDRYMEGRMHTPEWEEDKEMERASAKDKDARHKLEIDGDRRYFRLSDSSSSKTRNSHNRYEANGPLQIQPPAHNQLPIYSRAEPSGNAELMFLANKMRLEINPFFGAECLVARSERTGNRSSNKSGPEYLSLLDGVSPSGFTIIEEISEDDREFIEGSKTFDFYHGTLPFVPSFEVEVTVKYRLWRNGPPPKNKQ